MVTPQLEAHFAFLGVPMIPIRTGARWFVDELAESSGTEVVLGGEPRMQALAEDGHVERKVALRTRVDRGAYPYLADHMVAGLPVLPVVIALEWFARAARAVRPDLSLREIRDLRVLRGIRLEHFDGAGDWFDLCAHEVANGQGSELVVTLSRPGQPAPHYSARALLGAPAIATTSVPILAVEAYTGPLYDGEVLFHGHQFQVIREAGLSDRGGTATLLSTADVAWADEPWQTDPAALDGGLQLALLYTRRALGGASLPMSVAAVRLFQRGPAEGPVRAVLTGERRGHDKTVADIVFVDGAGRILTELRGVESILVAPSAQPGAWRPAAST
jgi:hypothetical protein